MRSASYSVVVFSLAFFAASHLSGCGVAVVAKKVAPPKAVGGGGSATWTNVKEDAIPGLDQAAVLMVGNVGDRGLLLWTDATGASGRHMSDNRGVSIDYAFLVPPQGAAPAGPHGDAKNQYRVLVKATNDGTGTIDVAGQRFNLENGNVILVRRKNANLVVLQLDRDLSQLQATKESLRPFGEADAEIRGFFSGEQRKAEKNQEKKQAD